MDRHQETLEQKESLRGGDGPSAGPPQPGLVLIFSAGRPQSQPIPLSGGSIEIGREGPALASLNDPLLSRRHARVAFDGRRFSVTDLGSRNGTAVDGQAVQGEVTGDGARVLRTGGTIFLLCADVRPFQVEVQGDDGMVMGPALREAWQVIASAARFGNTLHITGESGAGKELAARAFHRFGPCAQGPFIAVNCAAIPEGVAERLLFGARKGAYSGAVADTEGYAQAADRGTLFLDEVAELDLQVQAKLLRVLETREVLSLGASRPRAVDIRICSATHKDLRAQVGLGRLREDLFFRISRPQVALPPLRQRLEEVPWLIAREVKRVDGGLVPDASLVEACLLRHWPGNARELLNEVRSAAQGAIAVESQAVKAQHLSASAGVAFVATQPAPPPAAPVDPQRLAIEEALRREQGNVTRAARALGMHRTQLRRWLVRQGVDPQSFAISRAKG